MRSLIPNQKLLNERYRIQSRLGDNKLSRDYLAVDVKRSNQLCTLKEMAIALDSFSFKQLRIQIQRELILLYQLKHPQILSFQAVFEQEGRLFLVREYVESKTYRTLLKERQAQNQCFSELEVLQLCCNLLPVLGVMREVGIVHHNISLDTLFATHLEPHAPKELFASLEPPIPTKVDAGLSSNDESSIHPFADLNGLGLTCLELIIGKPSQTFLDERGIFNRDLTPLITHQKITHQMFAILTKMIATRSEERYPSLSAAQNDLHELLTQHSLKKNKTLSNALESKAISTTEQQRVSPHRSPRVSVGAIKRSISQSAKHWALIGASVSVLAFLSIVSPLEKPTLSHATDGVWIAGTHVSQAEVSNIISSSEQDAIASLSNFPSRSYFANVDGSNRFQPIELNLNHLPLTVQSTLQTPNLLYRLTTDQAQRLTITLESTGVKMTVLPSQQANTVEETSQWTGNLAAGGAYLIQLTGAGVYRLDIKEASP